MDSDVAIGEGVVAGAEVVVLSTGGLRKPRSVVVVLLNEVVVRKSGILKVLEVEDVVFAQALVVAWKQAPMPELK